MSTFHIRTILLGALLSLVATSLAAQSGQCSVAFSLNPPSPVPCGQSVTINATLQGIDSGTVAVSLDHQMFCGGSSSCSATASGLATGTHEIEWSCASGGAGMTQNSGAQTFSVCTPPPTSTRDFPMALWSNESSRAPIDADIAFFNDGDFQPQGPTILEFFSWPTPEAWQAIFTSDPAQRPYPENTYDFNRIEAVVVDEPYLAFVGPAPGGGGNWPNPCFDSRYPKIAEAYQLLQSLGQAIKETSPKTRFWINFSEPELQWMMDPICPLTLNGPFVDVVSLDKYKSDFSTQVQPYYDWLTAHLAYPGQQIALVPGTFVRIGLDDPTQQASLLAGFFDYADRMNTTCNRPLGATGVTGNFDGCLVWLVIGFNGDNFTDTAGIVWHGEYDPASGPIHAVWAAKLSAAIRYPPSACFSTSSLAFGQVTVGTSSGLQGVTLTDCGKGTMTMGGVTTSGDFAQTNNCGNSLAAGASCVFQVTFTPTASGLRTGALSVTDNAPGSPQSVNLSGTGLAPVVSLSPTSLAFGNRTVGTASAAQTVTLCNSGTVSLSITSISSSGDFAQTNNCGSLIGAGASCAINVTFTPTTTGVRAGTLRVSDDASSSPQTAALSGTGTVPPPPPPPPPCHGRNCPPQG